MSLVVQPGLRHTATGDPVPVGVPYGSRARLICIYLQSEALRCNSREVELGKSLHAWLRKLDISIGGKSMAAVRDQAERISRCRMSFQIRHGNRTGLVNQNILDTAMFVDDDSEQGSLFVERAKLSELFFEQLQKHPGPGSKKQLLKPFQITAWQSTSIAGSPTDCTYWTKQPPCRWKSLHGQFGNGIASLVKFRQTLPSDPGLGNVSLPGREGRRRGTGRDPASVQAACPDESHVRHDHAVAKSRLEPAGRAD